MKEFLPWKILHVAIREHLPDLSAETELGGMLVVFWCESVPVGQMSIPGAMLPISSSQLAATIPPLIARAVGNRLMADAFRAPLPLHWRMQSRQEPPDLPRLLELDRPLESLSRFALPWKYDPSETVVPLISVVICTRNRPAALEKCLASICKLSPQPDEIIVVDNDPSSGLTSAVTSAFPGVRYIPEPRPGLSAARNTGVRNCEGAVIAFTDDDVIVHSGWIEAIRSVFHDPDIIATTGLILPAELATRAQCAFQADSQGWGYRVLDFDRNFFNSMKHIGVPVWRIGAGANMAFRREAFDRIGFFDERLGAGASGCSEDSELWYRLLAEGYRCRYEPAAVVFHAHRVDWMELSDQMHSYMRGHVAALLFQFDRYRHWGNIYRAFVALPVYFMKLAYRSLRRTAGTLLGASGDGTYSLPLGMRIRGVFAGYLYYLRYRHHDANPANHGQVQSRGLAVSPRVRNDGT